MCIIIACLLLLSSERFVQVSDGVVESSVSLSQLMSFECFDLSPSTESLVSRHHHQPSDTVTAHGHSSVIKAFLVGAAGLASFSCVDSGDAPILVVFE